MNCLEFRRRLGSEPACTLDAFVAHRAECIGCAAAQSRADEFEMRLRRAVGVPLPANLADRILLAQTTTLRLDVRNRRRGFSALILAAAASIFIAVVALNRPAAEMPVLAAMVNDHLHEHIVSAEDMRVAVPSQDVIDIFAQRGVTLAEVPAGVNYVHKCPAGPYKTVHMVMPRNGSAVSVVYVVDAPPRPRADFRRDGTFGREVPMGGGALVMLGSSREGFDAIEDAWKSALGSGVAEASVAQARPAGPAFPQAGLLQGRSRIAAP
ncbi:MAG: DUF3379 family protein [Xanthomonadales bacterium]|uniref:DUF3379 family protein n=1 Tax=Dokdonella sp. TaxID=2291710 RepID=UPI002C8EE174|nr:DUF3379 family protein [Xanthomonadales bacterium]HQV72205.1 DUF3379 family protein [Dokdonella sp.]HQW76766.1 DUF3379 family protein [Dokdonella sp.]HQX65592.1 DUF3379 family protein [Dokdonella sp.]HQY55400.1 DUF3379 family protein [Dokdonella sp.]